MMGGAYLLYSLKEYIAQQYSSTLGLHVLQRLYQILYQGVLLPISMQKESHCTNLNAIQIINKSKAFI